MCTPAVPAMILTPGPLLSGGKETGQTGFSVCQLHRRAHCRGCSQRRLQERRSRAFPYKAKQVEAGVKYDMGKALATLSAFQIKQNGSMEKDDVLTSSGEVRHRGVEASLSGEPVKGTRLWGSLMYMDAKYTEDADYQGNYEMGIPKWTAVVGAEQDIHGVKGLSVNTRVTYNGSAMWTRPIRPRCPSVPLGCGSEV